MLIITHGQSLSLIHPHIRLRERPFVIFHEKCLGKYHFIILGRFLATYLLGRDEIVILNRGSQNTVFEPTVSRI